MHLAAIVCLVFSMVFSSSNHRQCLLTAMEISVDTKTSTAVQGQAGADSLLGIPKSSSSSPAVPFYLCLQCGTMQTLFGAGWFIYLGRPGQQPVKMRQTLNGIITPFIKRGRKEINIFWHFTCYTHSSSHLLQTSPGKHQHSHV